VDAIILVGGQGTRLRPLTARRHKSLVPVANEPAISYLFAWLRRSGFRRAVLAIGMHNDDLADAFPPGDMQGLELLHVIERQRLESGGAIRNAVEEAGIDDRFLVLNGDVYVDFDFTRALEAHTAANADLTLALTPVDDPSSFGVAVVDGEGIVTGFVEKPPPGTASSNLVNAGAWIFERRLVDEIPPGAVRVEETLFPSLVARRRRVLGYRFEGPWADIGTPQRYLELNRLLVRRAGRAILAPGVRAVESADESVLGTGCSVGDRAIVRRSVLWEDVRVGAGALVEDSILADGVTVGEGATVIGVVAGAGASIGAGQTLPRGTVLEAAPQYDPPHGR
jgi:mannose-1-phosphate guanylyltransferase